MTDRELMQQALDTLEDSCYPRMSAKHSVRYDEIVTALRERLAQQEQESVAVQMFRTPGCSDWYDGVPDQHEPGQHEVRTLYTSPQPSKPWVGLTYGEVLEQKKDDPIQFYRAIEAKLREKNT